MWFNTPTLWVGNNFVCEANSIDTSGICPGVVYSEPNAQDEKSDPQKDSIAKPRDPVLHRSNS